MRNSLRVFLSALSCLLAVTVSAAEMKLTLDVPTCKMPPGKPLPAKYYALAKRSKDFRWALKVRNIDSSVGGSGWERIDGTNMRDSYGFIKLDLNNDGLCDWFLISLAPYSTGGDSGVLNTLYLGSSAGWQRVGMRIPDNKPDCLGCGDSSEAQYLFAFSSDDLPVIWDRAHQTSYFVGRFYSRREGRPDQAGYHIYRWDDRKNTLVELDKWQPGSPAAEVYDFFKKHGAVNVAGTGPDRSVAFDPEVEREEYLFNCKDETTLKRSPSFAKLCQSRKD